MKEQMIKYADALLRGYYEEKQSMEGLKKELEQFSGVSASSVIESLSFGTPNDEHVQTGNVPDKTSSISEVYRLVTDKLNTQARRDIMYEIELKQSVLGIVERSIQRLKPEYAKIATALYIEGRKWDEMEDAGVYRARASRCRQALIREIASVLEVIDLTKR